MPADRHPEAPRLLRDLAARAVAGPLRDGDSFDEVELAGVACVGRVDGVECSGVVLRDPDLSGAELRDCAFRDAVFDNPNLATTTVRGGSLTRVVVEGGRLTGLQLAEAELRDCLWRGCGADMATIRHAKLAHVTFESCSLREADFAGMRGEHVRFVDCDLRGAAFHHAELAHSEMRRCRLDDLEGIQGLRGVAMELDELVGLAPVMAHALGIGLLDG
ncbi:MAG TPA: pentapeptide repeat-containing protein [Gaiellales bacterium]|nr:pentapeptide repeat-containing protein [Gaiellales bacterium]